MQRHIRHWCVTVTVTELVARIQEGLLVVYVPSMDPTSYLGLQNVMRQFPNLQLMQNIEQYLVMGLGQKITPLFLCVNLSAVCLSANPMFYKRTKHFEVDYVYHYVREGVSMKKLEVGHIPASLQITDVFTKSLVVVWQTRCLATSDT